MKREPIMRSSRPIRLTILLFTVWLIGCGGATPPPTSASVGNAAATVSIGGAETNSRLLALLARLADDRTPVLYNSQMTPQSPVITVGGLPTPMPFDLPLEPQTVILGSIVRKNSLRGEVLILLDVSAPAAEIVAFYQTELAKQGFTPWHPGGPQTFQPASQADLFCQRDKGIQLELDAYGSPDRPTDVRLAYDTNPLVFSCNEDVPDTTTYAQSLLPNLTLPGDVVLLGTSSGSGYDGWGYSQQDILTSDSPTNLDLFLRPQLQKAGWQLVAESQTDPVAWSKWKVTDPKGFVWSGVLIITAGQGSQNSRVLLFQIERAL